MASGISSVKRNRLNNHKFLLLISGFLLFFAGLTFIQYKFLANFLPNYKPFVPTITHLQKLLSDEKRKNQSIVLPILLYHYVEVVTDSRDTTRKSLSITPKTFEEQILTLLSNGYHPLPLSRLINYYEKGTPLTDKAVVLTFDDGYRDFYTDVFPILKRYHIPAVVYVVSGFLNSTRNYLSTDELTEISKEDFIEIGSHTVTHANLRGMVIDLANEEVRKSKIDLEKLTKNKVVHFAYPFGSFDITSEEAVKKAGYLTAATINKGTIQSYNDRFILRRIRPGSLVGEELLNLLNSPE